MEFYLYSHSERFVALIADQFVGRGDGLLEQQCRIAMFVEEITHFTKATKTKIPRINTSYLPSSRAVP